MKNNKNGPVSLLSKLIQAIKVYPVIIILIVFFIIFSALFTDRFLTPLSMSAIIRQFVTLMLFAVGPSIVLITGCLDLSFVGIWMLGGILVWLLQPIFGLASIFIFPILGMTTGFLVGVIQAKGKIPSFILTLSLLVTYWGVTAVISGGYPRTVKGFEFITANLIPNIPSVFLWSIPIIAIAIFIMKRTKFGVYLYAIGSNEEGTQLAGININKYKILAFTVSGLFSGISSIILFQHLGGSVPVQLNMNTMVWPLVAIILGGTPLMGGSGGPHRTILGAITLTIIIRGLTISLLKPEMIQLLVGLLLIIAIVIGSRGAKGGVSVT